MVESNEVRINGLPAIVFIADQKQEQQSIRVNASLIQFGENIYAILGITTLPKFPTYQAFFKATMNGFQELRDTEKLNRKPDVVRIKTVPRTMTLQAALKHFNMPEARMDELAILNGMALDDTTEKGMLLKVVGK
jgi:predicted Zn-dependent protease